MSFLSPWFLAAGLAVGVPIWLHLVRREQSVRVPFASLMFIRRLPVKSVSRQRLKYLLLLAARLLIILLIALAFARPYLPSVGQAFSGGAQQKHVVILLDTSASMGQGDRWQKAVAAARDAVSSLGERDRAQIVTFGSEYEIRNLATSDKAQLRAVLDAGISPTASTTSYTQAFRAVEKIAEDSSQALSVVLISDLQKSGVAGRQGFPSGPVSDFKLVDVAGKDAPNWTVSGARSHRVIYRAKYPDRLLVEIRGYNTPATKKDVTLSLGGRIVGRKSVEVAASGSATLTFDNFDVPLGSNQGEISLIPADDLPRDDTYHFVLERREPYRILFLREPGEDRELYYFRSALAAEPDSPFAIDARTPEEASSTRLGDYACVILSNVGALPAGLPGDLQNFVSQGRGLIATMGNRYPAPALEEAWKQMWPAKSVAKRMLAPDGERMVLLGQFDADHPLFREFQEAGAAESLRSAETFAYIRVEPQGRVALRFSNGDPALVERQHGSGRVLEYTSVFDNVWGDFPLHPAFIPLAHQMIRYAAGISDDPPAYAIPSSVPLGNYKLPSGGQVSAQVWDVIAPDGKHAVPLEEERRSEFLTLQQTGFYELRHSTGSHLIAANMDPRESDLTQLSADDRALWVASAASKPGAEGGGTDNAKRQNLWWYLLIFALIAALVEVYLANKYLHPQLGSQAGQPGAATATE